MTRGAVDTSTSRSLQLTSYRFRKGGGLYCGSSQGKTFCLTLHTASSLAALTFSMAVLEVPLSTARGLLVNLALFLRC